MQRVVVAVRRGRQAAPIDLEVPVDLPAAELARRLGDAIGEPSGRGPLEVRAPGLGRALQPHETLAGVGLWDGTTLVLARAGDPPAAELNGVQHLRDESALPLPLLAPPVFVPPVAAAAPRSNAPYVLAGIAAATVVIVAAWWFLSPRPAPAPSPAATPAVAAAPPAEPTAPPSAAAPQAADEDGAWRDLQTRLDTVWGVDWPASIALLQAFHSQYPTRAAASEKLYAALVEYGRALQEAGAGPAAAEAWDQAVRLAPGRLEARAELAALRATPAPAEEPAAESPRAPPATPLPAAAPTPAPTRTPAPAAVAVAPLPAPPVAEPPPAAPACDVRDPDIACPLADGASVQDSLSPNERHFYWFGVPEADMRLRVEVGGAACPCTVRAYFDRVDDDAGPLLTGDRTAAGSTLLEGVLANPGAYLLEVAPDSTPTDARDTYALSFALRPPAPTPVPIVEEAAPAPTATPRPVAMPPLVGRSASEANDRLRAVGLAPHAQLADRLSPGGVGTIAAQDPPAGSLVPPGSDVTLLVATGQVAVPVVVGIDEEDAASRLHAAGLAIDTRHARRGGVEAGRAAETIPPGGTVVAAGTTVILIISQGP